ncbi:hypothetical protein MTO96_023815 [Rhipicephalus appendiculatus]
MTSSVSPSHSSGLTAAVSPACKVSRSHAEAARCVEEIKREPEVPIVTCRYELFVCLCRRPDDTHRHPRRPCRVEYRHPLYDAAESVYDLLFPTPVAGGCTIQMVPDCYWFEGLTFFLRRVFLCCCYRKKRLFLIRVPSFSRVQPTHFEANDLCCSPPATQLTVFFCEEIEIGTAALTYLLVLFLQTRAFCSAAG